ncbi:MAG: hypothetical protein QM723_11560 [Myxococcaceae bacterium]
MSADVEISDWLGEQGYGLPAARERALQALITAGITRAGKARISVEKLPRAEEQLGSRFFLHCPNPECVTNAKASGREPVLTSEKNKCNSCGGSDNRRAVKELIDAFASRGWKKLVVVGGSPSVREELERSLGSALTLRVVDGTERRPIERAKADLDWADVVLVWSASELHHKVSLQYTQVAGEAKKKLVHCHRRGIAQLLGEAVAHARK